MKIINKKEPLGDWNLKVICKESDWNQDGLTPCGSTLEVDKNDILNRDWARYPYEEGIDYGVICPVCGCFAKIDESSLPELCKTKSKPYFEAKNEGGK